jgi:hypothetical protein
VFTLSISVTASSIDIIKHALTLALPGVKSSHRCEAFARGVGYRTYASLLAATRADDNPVAIVDGAAFRGYLAQHDFNVAAPVFYRAVAKAALVAVSAAWPRLTGWGMGVGDRERRPDGQWESAADQRKKLEEGREDLISDHSIEPFLASLAFVSRVARTKTIRAGTSSYWLKHIAEAYACTYPDDEELGPVYVPNGVLIAAAIHAGFKVGAYTDDYGFELLNTSFNMSRPSLVDLDCEIRPKGARAQSRRRRAERGLSL